MKKGINKGSNNGFWSENPAYSSLHAWVRRNKLKPQFCENCHLKVPYDVANKSGKYLRDINDYKWLCRKCHIEEDGRIKNLLKGGGLAWSKTKNRLTGEKNSNWKNGVSLDKKAYAKNYNKTYIRRTYSEEEKQYWRGYRREYMRRYRLRREEVI